VVVPVECTCSRQHLEHDGAERLDVGPTFATVPLLSLAFAVIVIDAGAVKLAPLAGAVRLTVGGVFGGGGGGGGGATDLQTTSTP